MHILSFTVDFIIDQNVSCRRDCELASSAFEVVRKHTIVALKPNIKIWLIFTHCCHLGVMFLFFYSFLVVLFCFVLLGEGKLYVEKLLRY